MNTIQLFGLFEYPSNVAYCKAVYIGLLVS